jgi:hypothetical protein
MKPLEAAQFYIERHFWPIPIPFREKAPVIRDWTSLRITAETAPQYFNGKESNIGVILGDNYGSTDIDLDSEEAIWAAQELLPETRFVFGRKSKPKSHYFYRSDPPVRSRRYLDPATKECLIELRCRKADGTPGLQTLTPPSVHPSGELIEFEPGFDGAPANVDADVLERAVARVAAASLLARHFPAEGARNEAFCAMAGALARGGWPEDDAVSFHRAIYRALWKRAANLDQAAAEVRSTFAKHASGAQTTGLRRLSELLDKRILDAALQWLNITREPEPRRAAAPAAQKPKVIPRAFSMEVILEDATIQSPDMMIEDFLPRQGLMLFGGRPKEGKSWFACQLALSVATGQSFIGRLQVLHPGRVQLWALEDGLPLTKDKVSKILNGRRPDGLRELGVFPELPLPILGGGDEVIREALRQYPAELVILDSLFKLTGARNPKADISQTDYDIIDRCRRIALEHNCAVVVIMHTKKGASGNDPIENLLGTTGNTAAADVLCELKRKGRQGSLAVVGRFTGRKDFALDWNDSDETGWGWAIAGEGEADEIGETMQDVLAYLQAQGSSQPATIARALRKSFRAVWCALERLRARGLVVREGRRWTACE